MKLIVLEEHGYESALKGLALSYYREGYSFNDWWGIEREAKAKKQLETLAFKGGGHNKALESIVVWLLITAHRGWWQEMDTYRVGVSKNSASSMHTLLKEPVTAANFEEGTSILLIDNLNKLIAEKADINVVKCNLPEGYLQTRQLCINYMTLQNILRQREGHRLKQWKVFIEQVLGQVEHPELLKQGVKL
jgi:hypothetical protein